MRRVLALLVALVPLALAAGLSGCGRVAGAARATPTPDASAVALTTELAALRAEATARARATAMPAPTATPAATATPVPPTPTLSPEEAAARLTASTAFVLTTLGDGARQAGTGMVVAPGAVLTARHVVDGARAVAVTLGAAGPAPARVVRADSRRDLALLAVPTGDAPPVELGDAKGLQPGAPLLVVGYPRPDAIGAAGVTVTRGIYSGHRTAGGGVGYVQTDAAVNRGNSGGPVADAGGRVVGVADFVIRDASGLNFAVDADEVRAFLDSPDNPPTPAPDARAQFFAALDPVLQAHEATRTRLYRADADWKAGKITDAAFDAEVRYQAAQRAQTRDAVAALEAWPAALADPALRRATADLAAALGDSVDLMVAQDAALVQRRARSDPAWAQIERASDAITARYEAALGRLKALRG